MNRMTHLTKQQIAEILKNLRKRSHFTGVQVAELLKSCGLDYTVKAIYNWETGRSQPDCETFLCLCDIYGVEDVLKTFNNHADVTEGVRLNDCRRSLESKIELLDEQGCCIAAAYIDGLMTDNAVCRRDEECTR